MFQKSPEETYLQLYDIKISIHGNHLILTSGASVPDWKNTIYLFNRCFYRKRKKKAKTIARQRNCDTFELQLFAVSARKKL